ncbi:MULTISPECIES: energy transducer TonB [Sphingobium]|uniref:Energy transducer TonB n=1 Tax=Sphingobium tyrosinilyticum TaxID=2715436 RepID=A0ABV9EUR4_9SPHN|nr:energy transducer TonB [Sphingobium sp. EP60837]ANI77339.1 Zinc finger protein ZIC [Sphingobium sp. EP60837]
MRSNWAQRWPGRGKIAPALAALIVNLVIGYALIMGLRATPLLRAVDDARLTLFDLKPLVEEKPEPVKPAKVRETSREGGATPAPRPRATEEDVARLPLVAPVPVIVVPAPASPAAAPPAGAVDGLGSGGGGAGSGSGSGGSGDGTGAGTGTGAGDGGAFSRARQTGGRFRNSDFPDWLRGAGRVKIGVRYAIGPSGHVDQCEIIEKSGYAEVDAMTCRIIMERYRFRPARDPDGYAVTEVREEDYRWRVR